MKCCAIVSSPWICNQTPALLNLLVQNMPGIDSEEYENQSAVPLLCCNLSDLCHHTF